MILPIYAYGAKVLKQVAQDIDEDFGDLTDLVSNMWETMYNANGVGLAAPQVGRSVRIFLVDTVQLEQDDDDHIGIKQVFVNAQILETAGDHWSYEEGCLSIPKIRGDVMRPEKVRISYRDENLEEKEQTFDGINARVILHEYDHLEGKLFTEYLKPVKRRLIRRKLEAIKKGQFEADYPVRLR